MAEIERQEGLELYTTFKSNDTENITDFLLEQTLLKHERQKTLSKPRDAVFPPIPTLHFF